MCGFLAAGAGLDWKGLPVPSMPQLVQAPVPGQNVIFTPRGPAVYTPSVLDLCKISNRKITRHYDHRRADVMLPPLALGFQAKHKRLPKILESAHVFSVRNSHVDALNLRRCLLSEKGVVQPRGSKPVEYVMIQPVEDVAELIAITRTLAIL